MIIYSVTVAIEAAIESEWLDWVRRVHVPDVLRTGCFAEATIYELIDPKSDDPTYVIQYQCSAMEEYQRYRDHFAAALQKEQRPLQRAFLRFSADSGESVNGERSEADWHCIRFNH
jgi:hypothetical protein